MFVQKFWPNFMFDLTVKRSFFIHLWKAKPNHTSPANDQENSIVCHNIPGKIPTREMNWLLLALLLLLYYCVSHESFPFFHSCLSLIFILLFFFCCCVNVYMCYLHILFILCPKSCVRSFFFLFFHIYLCSWTTNDEHIGFEYIGFICSDTTWIGPTTTIWRK